jgi:glutamate carboxypeptidase
MELRDMDGDPGVVLAQKLRAHCESCMPAMEKLFGALVAIDSPTDDVSANQRCLRLLGQALTSINFAVTELPTPQGHVHLLARRQGQQDPIPLILVSHVDTVHHASESFSGIRMDGDRAIGPGVADMKGGIIVMLTALDTLAAMGVLDALDVRVFINSDEELQSSSSHELLSKASAGAEIGLVFDAARPDGAIVGSRRATGLFQFNIQGRAAHPGEAVEAGRNAIQEAAVLVQRIEELNDPIRGIWLNCAVLRAGTEATIVAAHAELMVDARCDRAEDVPWLESKMNELANESVRGCTTTVSGSMGRPAWSESFGSLQLYDIWLEAAGNLGLGTLELAHAGSGSDGNLLHSFGIPTLDGLGPVGGDQHTDEEWIELASIPERAALTALSILMWLHRRSEGIWTPGGAQ